MLHLQRFIVRGRAVSERVRRGVGGRLHGVPCWKIQQQIRQADMTSFKLV
jgi:hypothetical protein